MVEAALLEDMSFHEQPLPKLLRCGLSDTFGNCLGSVGTNEEIVIKNVEIYSSNDNYIPCSRMRERAVGCFSLFSSETLERERENST